MRMTVIACNACKKFAPNSPHLPDTWVELTNLTTRGQYHYCRDCVTEAVIQAYSGRVAMDMVRQR